MIYTSKSITNQKWLFISYTLCDFTANTKQILCKTRYQCGALILDQSPGKYHLSCFDANIDIKFMLNDRLSGYE